jgi:hypothetical protein
MAYSTLFQLACSVGIEPDLVQSEARIDLG